MIIGFVVFGLFLFVMIVGIFYIIKSDNNTPDTTFLLAVRRMNNVLPEIAQFYSLTSEATKKANEALVAFAQSFKKFVPTEGEYGEQTTRDR